MPLDHHMCKGPWHQSVRLISGTDRSPAHRRRSTAAPSPGCPADARSQRRPGRAADRVAGASDGAVFARRGPAGAAQPITDDTRGPMRDARSAAIDPIGEQLPCPRSTTGRAAAPLAAVVVAPGRSRSRSPPSAATRAGRGQADQAARGRRTPGRSSRWPATSRRPPARRRPSPASRTSPPRLLAAFPTTRSLGIVRACSVGGRSEHKEGRAFDWGVSAQLRQAAPRSPASCTGWTRPTSTATATRWPAGSASST